MSRQLKNPQTKDFKYHSIFIGVTMSLAGEGRVEKRFRVAREGQTVDGRELTRQEIQEMADSYHPEHYGARINVEHWNGFSPEPPFNAYGDIIKVEAVEENGKLCLYNTISALPNFIKMNKDGQKIYPSIEFYRNFAGTGKAYQVGLGLTDTPASLGTQPIKFSQNPNSHRTQPDKEIFMTTETKTDEKTFIQQLKELMTSQPKPQEKDELNETVAAGLVQALNQITALTQQVQKLSSKIEQQAETSVATPVPATPDAFAQALQPITQAVSQLQNQIQTLSVTPVNTPPSVSGNNTDQAPY